MKPDEVFNAYDKWKKTPEGQKMLKEEKEWIPVEIPKDQLSKGWELENGSVEEEYFEYYNIDEELQLAITTKWGAPCWAGGYPNQHYVTITEMHTEEEEEEPTEVKQLNIGELGWKEAWKQANEYVLKRMKGER